MDGREVDFGNTGIWVSLGDLGSSLVAREGRKMRGVEGWRHCIFIGLIDRLLKSEKTMCGEDEWTRRTEEKV